MKKTYSWPESHWNWPINVTHKHGVRCGQMIWVGGQVDLTADGEVCNVGNLATQTNNVIANFSRVLGEFGSDLTDLVFLNCFYVNDGSVDESVFLTLIANALPEGCRTAITPIPAEYLCYDGLQVEIEGYAMLAEDGQKLPRTYSGETVLGLRSDRFCTAVRCGEMIFVSAQSPMAADGKLVGKDSIVTQSEQVASNIGRALACFGADFDDVVKINRWYCGSDNIEDFEPAALSFAANFSEPGPAATGVPLPRHANRDELVRIGVIAMLGTDGQRLPRKYAWPDSLWDWHVHLPYKHGIKCSNMIFLGGQVSLNKRGQAEHPGELGKQTHQAMAHIQTILKELGANYEDVCKVMTVYQGGCSADDLHENLPIRSAYFPASGPATTGVPLPVLAYDSMCIEIDIYAMAE
ncbi:MAG: enamine deaminase RidA (YjgF/YER057c/UK114 family) [Parasphingorhabdus sp.]|jgi:enamine deaminase RidA (YjgF/YER057c/UK114 family)